VNVARRLVLAGALAVLAAAAPAAARQAGPQIVVDAPAIAWSRHHVAIEVGQRGPLAGRRLSVSVFVDENLVGQFPTNGATTEIRVADLDLAAGVHRLMVKSGTHRATARFRHVPPIYAALAAAFLAAAATTFVWRASRRPRA
jgi:hypothetical protein